MRRIEMRNEMQRNAEMQKCRVLPPFREAPADKESVRLNATGFQVEVGERLTSTYTPKKWKLTFHFTRIESKAVK